MFRKNILLKFVIVLFIIFAAGAGYLHLYRNIAANGEEGGEAVSVSINNKELAAAKKQKEEEKAKKEAEEKARLQQWQTDMEASIKAYLGNDISKIGLVYYDLGSAQKIAVNEEKVFTAASTVKVQLNMIAYDWVKQGKLSLDEKLQYISADYEGGTGILQGMDKSKPIPVQTLLDYSIKYSDNIATHMLQRRLGGAAAVKKMANEMVGTNTDTSSNFVTAEEEFRLLKKLYENQNDPNYSRLITDMKNTEFHDRIDKYLPHEIVAHKIGNYSNFINDVGIIYTEKPYILVIYTQGLSGTKDKPAEEKIAGLSKMIYDAQLKK